MTKTARVPSEKVGQQLSSVEANISDKTSTVVRNTHRCHRCTEDPGAVPVSHPRGAAEMVGGDDRHADRDARNHGALHAHGHPRDDIRPVPGGASLRDAPDRCVDVVGVVLSRR